MVQRAIRLDDTGVAKIRLTLRYRGRCLNWTSCRRHSPWGRDTASSLMVDAEWVSRNHALIEYKRGYFSISDRSTNGTYVKLGEDDELRLHRDEVHLRKNGVISLGQTMALNPDHVLYFQCDG